MSRGAVAPKYTSQGLTERVADVATCSAGIVSPNLIEVPPNSVMCQPASLTCHAWNMPCIRFGDLRSSTDAYFFTQGFHSILTGIVMKR